MISNDEIILAARLSSRVYQGDIPNAARFDVDGIQGCTVEIDDATWVLFRGTDETSDWLVNLDAAFTDKIYGSVHSGFDEAFQKVKSKINLPKKPSSRVIVAGHSMGGALAVLCAHSMRHTNHNITLITFGQPRVGNYEFCNSICINDYIRVVNSGDIATKVPPYLSGFRHTGKEIWFNQDGETNIPSFWGRITGFFSSIGSSWKKFDSAAKKNHDIKKYIKNCENLDE